MNIVLIGPPGSGKGTQASIISKNLLIPSISTGELLRQEVNNKTEIGKLADSYIKDGRLVPDEIVIKIIESRINKDTISGFILDGFPRNISQADSLEKMLSGIGKKIDIVFNFEIDEEALVKRIFGRYSCKECGETYNKYFKPTSRDGICDSCHLSNFESRSDDNEDTVKKRLRVYYQSTFDLIEYYQKKSLLISISAIKSAPLISEDISKAIINLTNN